MLNGSIIDTSDSQQYLDLFGKKRNATLQNEYDQWMGEFRSAYPYTSMTSCQTLASYVQNLDARMATATGAVGQRWIAAASEYKNGILGTYNQQGCGVVVPSGPPVVPVVTVEDPVITVGTGGGGATNTGGGTGNTNISAGDGNVVKADNLTTGNTKTDATATTGTATQGSSGDSKKTNILLIIGIAAIVVLGSVAIIVKSKNN